MNQRKFARTAVWLRRDFRLHDQPALTLAASLGEEAIPFFVLDPSTIRPFDPGRKPHASFFGALIELRDRLRAQGRDLVLIEGDAVRAVPDFCRRAEVGALVFARDYEPSAVIRDRAVEAACVRAGVRVELVKDHALSDRDEILTRSGTPYRVFGQYARAYARRIAEHPESARACPGLPRLGDPRATLRLARGAELRWRKLEVMVSVGRYEADGGLPVPGEECAARRLREFGEHALAAYHEGRNLPAIAGTSRLSADLRNGSISPRQIHSRVLELGDRIPAAAREKFLTELAWRDFFYMIAWHYPRALSEPFKDVRIAWRRSDRDFRAWSEGRTGYPLVDAGMRELRQTGFMHNRVRIVTAMFLCKHLLLDYRLGEKFFLEHLIDGDAEVNNGNWQWAASTGVDAQPFFRIHNPVAQSEKLDPEGAYIRRWIPELAHLDNRLLFEPWRASHTGRKGYPAPIVGLAEGRDRALRALRAAFTRESGPGERAAA